MSRPRRPRRPSLALAVLLTLTAPLSASGQAALGDGPLTLEAADGVEWRRQEQLFVAEGDAVARQAAVQLNAERLVAAYRTKDGGAPEIFRVDAEGGVRIDNDGDVATGTRAAFDLETRAIVLSGPGLTYVAGDIRVTAEGTMEYDLEGRVAVARGDARVQDRRGRLTADVIEARFQSGADGGLAVARAWGGVLIETETETVVGKRAQYDFARRRADVVGDVRIRRGENVLTGARATVDLVSGISTIAGATDGGRVKGLVFPKAVR